MAVNFRKVTQNDSGLFGPTSKSEYYYKPKEDHNPTKKRGLNQSKSHWIYTGDGQFCVFDDADENDRRADAGLLGLDIEDKKLNQLGQDGEKVAFFPRPQNNTDPWHGHPCTMEKVGDDFDEIITTMHQNEMINKSTYNKLIKKSI